MRNKIYACALTFAIVWALYGRKALNVPAGPGIAFASGGIRRVMTRAAYLRELAKRGGAGAAEPSGRFQGSGTVGGGFAGGEVPRTFGTFREFKADIGEYQDPEITEVY